MNGFRLIAIRPLHNCHKDYLKVLKENEIYKFYDDYMFLNKNGTIVVKDELVHEIVYNSTVPKELYNINQVGRNPIHVNISAIVGKNGSGKSTLIELFFAAVYILSIKNQILEEPSSNDKKLFDEYSKLRNGLNIEIYYSINDSAFCLRFGEPFQGASDKVDSYIKETNGKEGVNKNIFSWIKGESIPFDIKLFFYSIAVNYSIYGLNSIYTGDWINALFHKNDGYQTPIVINPMRIEGNIDVNNEFYLAKSRLLSNILVPASQGNDSHRKISDYQRVNRLIFSLNDKKIEHAIDKGYPGTSTRRVVSFNGLFDYKHRKSFLLETIYKELFDVNMPLSEINSKYGDVLYKTEVEKYIIKKLIKISDNYDQYRDYFILDSIVLKDNTNTPDNEIENGNSFKNLPEYLKLLKSDKSHITFKLRQAINYIKYNILKNDEKHKWKTNPVLYKDKSCFTIDIDTLSNRINAINPTNEDLINFIPPPLFDVKIGLVENVKGKNENESFFESLSSGEQQLVHTVQSIIYHLTM